VGSFESNYSPKVGPPHFQNLPTLGPLPSVKINTKYYLKINKNPMILEK
jgi:hypothetical protein